ncbi:unnamed protein product [Didymodactylos carnosus]|uniref:Uncharacterized protein n=1 Tax=Didymodactylos carnosus TaxID=1234261 RepID=A0A814RJK9_9BILA|nr:unnamed protein product [Didymodactylos carnosus]CAF1180182.1 unnamed protein product [Didymodactylos carnosus]CAF3898516.1 unnamed protein product [Didymodactylos carnosus]CAF3991445.1 unnamed protein product [Didymodactylos carnosus]
MTTYSETQRPRNVLYTVANGPYTDIPSNSVLQAFVTAYNNHEDLILSPDDIWMVICINYALHVNENAEQLRHLFVDHQGKKQLTIREPPGKEECDWTDFFDRIKQEIEKNIKGTIVSTLTSNFSTTGKVEAILSNTCIMDTLQDYFEYDRCMTACGIRDIKFMGTLDDWKLLREKTEQMKAYSQQIFHEYVDNLLPVLDEFIQTYQNKVNLDWWNKVMDIKSTTGSGACTYISGWILRLFFLYVEMINEVTGLQNTCYVVGGFHGVN